MIMTFKIPEPMEVSDVFSGVGGNGRTGSRTRGRARPVRGPLGGAHAQATRPGARGSPWGDRDFAGPACVLATKGTLGRTSTARGQTAAACASALERAPVIGPVARTVRRILTADRAESQAFIRAMNAVKDEAEP